ncbi:hypothetical protein M8494_37860 [Serratia ureilytica]
MVADPALPEAVVIDGERLLQVANNPINNAIKFALRGIQVEIGARRMSGRGIASDGERQRLRYRRR